MKAKYKGNFKQLEGILDYGDVVDIKPILSTEERVMSFLSFYAPSHDPFKRGIQYITTTPDQISPKGSFIDYKFKSKNGKTYSGACIRGFIGFISLDKLFVKN